MYRQCTGCGVGMDALGSPMGAAAIIPPLMIRLGLAAKKAGRHNTMSASLPASNEPTTCTKPRENTRKKKKNTKKRNTQKKTNNAETVDNAPRCCFILCAVCQ